MFCASRISRGSVFHKTAPRYLKEFLNCSTWGIGTRWCKWCHMMSYWWLIFGSKLGQIMACCLMAPSHYLNQWWLIIKARITLVVGTWLKCPPYSENVHLVHGRLTIRFLNLKYRYPYSAKLPAVNKIFALQAFNRIFHGVLWHSPQGIHLWRAGSITCVQRSNL